MQCYFLLFNNSFYSKFIQLNTFSSFFLHFFTYELDFLSLLTLEFSLIFDLIQVSRCFLFLMLVVVNTLKHVKFQWPLASRITKSFEKTFFSVSNEIIQVLFAPVFGNNKKKRQKLFPVRHETRQARRKREKNTQTIVKRFVIRNRRGNNNNNNYHKLFRSFISQFHI